jgi:hypothetical protein
MLKDTELHLKNSAAEIVRLGNRLPAMKAARDVFNAAENLKEWAAFLFRVATDMTSKEIGDTKNWQDTD